VLAVYAACGNDDTKSYASRRGNLRNRAARLCQTGEKEKEEETVTGKTQVIVPGIRKSDLTDLLSTCFSKRHENARKRFEGLFRAPADLTIVWTGKTKADNSIQIEVL
jgi:hypothetical protein